MATPRDADLSRRSDDPARRRWAVYLAWAGAATATWDVVSVEMGGRTLKTSALFFGSSILLSLATTARRDLRIPAPGAVRWTLIATSVLLGWLGVRSLFTGDLVGSISGYAAQLIPAALPLLAILLVRQHAASILRAFVIGLAAAAGIAVCEYLFRWQNWGWLTDYEARFGDRPRTAAFAFEAAFLAAPMFCALMICLVWWKRTSVKVALTVLFTVGLATTNARIVAVQAAIALAGLVTLLFVLRPPERDRARRGLLITVGALTIVGLATLVVRPDAASTAIDRVASIFDSDEPTSNAPRLEKFEQTLDVISDHPIVGIGPGMLGDEFSEDGVPTSRDAEFVTNNVWTQMLVDGGAIALVIQLCLVGSALATLRRSSTLEEAIVLLAWTTLVCGAGLTVSNFWDTEPWVLLACSLSLSMNARLRSSQTSTVAAARTAG